MEDKSNEKILSKKRIHYFWTICIYVYMCMCVCVCVYKTLNIFFFPEERKSNLSIRLTIKMQRLSCGYSTKNSKRKNRLCSQIKDLNSHKCNRSITEPSIRKETKEENSKGQLQFQCEKLAANLMNKTGSLKLRKCYHTLCQVR